MVHQPRDFNSSQLTYFQSFEFQDHFRKINLIRLNHVNPTSQAVILVFREEITLIQSVRHPQTW